MSEEVRDQSAELLEEWDWETAQPTGRAVRRGYAHTNGIAHEGVHLWVVRFSGSEPEVLFQKRARIKEMYPNCLDITVGGHVTYGISEGKIQKEAWEEIGLKIDEQKLVDLGFFRYEEIDGEIFHREFQHVYVYVDERPLEQYGFNDGEVEGIYAVRLRNLVRMMKEDVSFETEGFDGKALVSEMVSKKNFHPLLFAPSMEKYMEILLKAIDELFRTGNVRSRMPAP